MRTIDVRLHKEYADILMAFGTLNEVVDILLSYVENGEIDMESLPQPPPKDGCSKYMIIVNNAYYENELDTYTTRSSKLSLRRLLYWFVDNEMWEMFPIVQKNKYIPADPRVEKFKQNYAHCIYSLEKLLRSAQKVSSQEDINIIKDAAAMLTTVNH